VTSAAITQNLPVDALLPEIVASLRQSPNLVIEAAPGAGKTTRVPPALLQFGGSVLVLEPRRIAARMAARRVAAEMGEQVGETVGYQVRFEDTAGPRTCLRFLTEGVLTRRLITDPELRGVGIVVLDEFHERHLETDLSLALLWRLQKTRRPDLRIVVMSATLDSGPLRQFLGGCPAIRSEGRLFGLTTVWTPYSASALEEQVLTALESVITGGIPGDVLVFLPGAAAIHRATRVCEPIARRHKLLLTQLYGDLPPAEQDRAVEPSPQRKVILSTNVAESSITIDGVRVVIDSGLARVAADSPGTGLPSLEVCRVSKASAIQRAGRAGRAAPGHVIRLYTADDFQRRADHDDPEITRRELSRMCLHLESMGIHDPLEMEWLTPPPAAALEASESLLDRLRARGGMAAKMARMPLHPRLSRMMLDAEQAGIGEAGCRTAALLSSGQRVRSSDLFAALEEEPDQRTRAVFDQLRRCVHRGKAAHDDDALAKAVLAGFPDRVGRRRANGIVLLSNGGSAVTTHDLPQLNEFLVAIDIEESRDQPSTSHSRLRRTDQAVLRLACPIQPEWLIDLFPDRVREQCGVEWNRQAERVESVNALVYDELAIQETRGGPIGDEAAAKLLAAKAAEAGIGRFVDPREVDAFIARVEFAAEHSSLKRIGESEIAEALEAICRGLRSFSDLERAAGGLLPALERNLDSHVLDRIAPARLRLAGGRNTKVNYERGKPPWVASRLQDFFGMTESPRIANGKVPLVIHLLAPNQRPVQTTTDLAGFWQRLYPQLRRELGRRYPRHAWPEKPV
jgi:ATP-dependent helicase HrpB